MLYTQVHTMYVCIGIQKHQSKSAVSRICYVHTYATLKYISHYALLKTKKLGWLLQNAS